MFDLLGTTGRLKSKWLPALAALILLGVTGGASQRPPPGPGSLTLTELLERVQARHPLVGASDSRVAAARGARRAAGAFPNPTLGLLVENATLPGRDVALGMDREDMATATIPLEFVYQRGSRVRRADAELDAARAEGLMERQRIALEAVFTYYRTALADIEVTAGRELAAWLDSLVAYNRNRVAEGITGEADLLRTELERDRAVAELTLRETMAIESRAGLWAFYGDSGSAAPGSLAVRPPDSPLWLSDSTPPVHGSLPATHGLQASRARLAAAGAGVGMAQSMLVRDLSVMAGLKRSDGTTTLMAGLSLPLPLVDQNRGEIERARAEREVAMFELAATERQAQAGLSAATGSLRLLTERVESLRGPADTAAVAAGERVRYLARADEARRIALGAYREGAAPLFVVLDAARAWGEAQTTYYRTLFAQQQAAMALLAAQGRDLFTEIPRLLPQAAPKE